MWFKFNVSYPLTFFGSILFLILGTSTMIDYYSYLRLSTKAEVSMDEWKVVKKSSSAYPIKGRYHYTFQEKIYESSSFFPPPYEMNRISAQKKIEELKKHTWSAWIDPHQPTFSSLEKAFPLKKSIYALICLGVTLYFWFVETSSKMRNPTN